MASQLRWSGGGNLFRETPVTIIVLVCMVIGFLLSNIAPSAVTALAFYPLHPIPNVIPGLLTYHFVFGARDIIGLLFSGYIFWWAGGSLERGWLTRTYLLYLAGVSIVSALIWEIGVWLIAREFMPVGSPWLLVSAVLVSWAWLNPEATVLFAFVLPMKARWIGWITIAILFFTFPPAIGPLRLLMGIFALGGVAFSAFFVWYQRTWAWIPRRRQKRSKALRLPSSTFWGSLTRPYREWQRRRRVAYLQRTIKFDD